ncbi:uncharacterized protein LOC108100918 [Drosophila ficusphila]|uniref:uncharacterized protein LOC108100918 n=1 Tax=Drosophila ficusphila TaxID=30025 RepID=UPI0007E60008|nr:uncharacterized protein LOC108100918 [Drosophila ficusphila]
MYMLATGKDKEPESKRIATFLWLAGSKATEIYNTLFPNDGSASGMVGCSITNSEPTSSSAVVVSRPLEDVLKAFDEYSIPMKNITMESYKFNSIAQAEGQPFVEFETKLRKQAQLCDFKCECGKSFENRMLIDRLIIGVNITSLKLKLLESKKKNLEDIIIECKSFEAETKHNVLLQRNVDQCQSIREGEETESGAVFGSSHVKECRAKEISCFKCGKLGHFTKFCKQPKAQKNWKAERAKKRSSNVI